jgi:hypothetical protein
MIGTPDGQIYAINCSGDIICFDLGEPIRAFHIGFYYFEIDYQSNSTVNFEQTLDAQLSISSNQQNESSISNSLNNINNNMLCAVFVSSITNKLCLLQTEAILPYSKIKPSNSQFKYKCENLLTKPHNLNPRLYQIFEVNDLIKNNSIITSSIIQDILYTI